jgi:hypothetical protein
VSGSKISQKKIDAMKKRVYNMGMGDNRKRKIRQSENDLGPELSPYTPRRNAEFVRMIMKVGFDSLKKKLCGGCRTFKTCYRDEKAREGFDLKAMPGCVNWDEHDSGNGANQ